MVTLLITALAILVTTWIGLYFWRKSAPDTSEKVLPPPPNTRSLFTPDASSLKEDEAKRLGLVAAEQNQQLIARAAAGDRSVLAEAQGKGDGELYGRVLDELLSRSDSDAKLLAVMSYVSRHSLPVNDALAHAVVKSWRQSPDRQGTAKALHFAALSNNAELFGTTVQSALAFWREGKLSDISAAELRTLFDGEFWILSSRARGSGAGFILKQTLASARRELEAAPRATR